MSENSKQKILNRLKKTPGVAEEATRGFSFFNKSNKSAFERFEEKVIASRAEFEYCSNIVELTNKLQKKLKSLECEVPFCDNDVILKILGDTIPCSNTLTEQTKVSITGCDFLIAQTGSVIISSEPAKGRRSFVYPPVHMVVAHKGQLVDMLDDGIIKMIEKKNLQRLPSQITCITGPSRTADIEKTLVLGAHGPNMLIIFYLDE